MTDAPQPSPRSAADLLADLCLYAPIGFLLEANKYVPELAEKGRSQVALARFIGQFAVGRINNQLAPLLQSVSGPAKLVCDALGLNVPGGVRVSDPSAGSGPAAPGEPEAADVSVDRTGLVSAHAGPLAAGSGEPAVTDAGAAAPEVGAPGPLRDFAAVEPAERDLAIPGYATLAASQVVPRLASLSIEELAVVRRFESSHRARRTILNRVDQLLAKGA